VGVVFRTPTNGTIHHCYRVEAATSLVSAAWTPVRTIAGCDAKQAVTNAVSLAGDTAFYRVVATSNSAEYVDGYYLAIDVSGGTGASSYPVAYYDNASAVPGGVTNGLYKTDQILLRRIPAGIFTMGSPTGELGRETWSYSPDGPETNETQRQVTLTKDFYIGVFEVTQKQWALVMGTWQSWFTNVIYRDSRPADWVSYYELREDPSYKDDPAVDWPSNTMVNANSFMGKLRAKTGLTTLDLPTDAQWEYACRAGTTTALNSGHNLTNTTVDAQMAAVGRYYYNGGANTTRGCDPSAGTAIVGSYLPNAWGLYDMHGNLGELCLDWYETYHAPTTDPVGAEAGTRRAERGSSWGERDTGRNRSAFRRARPPNSRGGSTGFRLCMTLP
jgi:formylglycine-generating enzyme required for sulfatase activity